METTLKFYRGTNTIGGTTFSIEYKDERFIADFGTTMTSPLYDDLFDVRVDRIEDMITLGKAPDIPNFYDNNHQKTVVGISHMHLDHNGCIEHIPSDIPIWTSNGSKKLYHHLTVIEDGQPGVTSDRLTECQVNQSYCIDQYIHITFIPVNHDVLGSCAIRIDTPDTSIMYSGDIKFEARDKDTLQWVKESYNVDYLIIETTSYSFDEENKAERIDVGFDEILMTHQNFILNLYHRNIDNIIQWIDKARQLNYELIVDEKIAYLIEQYYKYDLSHVSYYDSVKPAQTVNIQSIRKITFDEGLGKQNVIIQNDYRNMLLLNKKSLSHYKYLHNNGMPLGDFDPSFKVLKEWLLKLDIEFISFHQRGHASIEELNRVVELIQPGVLIPQHGFHPERLQYKHRILPIPYEEYVL